MSIESVCPGCQRSLKVADEHAGQEAQCPVCGAIYLVPAHVLQIPPALAHAADAGEYFVLIPTGAEFGPVSTDVIEQWVREYRLNEACFFRAIDQTEWTSMLEWSKLKELRKPRHSGDASLSTKPLESTQVFGDIPLSADNRIQYPKASQGWTVLILSLVSIPLCLTWVGALPVVIIALVIGFKDLSSIRRGETSPDQRHLTQVGMILAGTLLFLNCIGLLLLIVAILTGV